MIAYLCCLVVGICLATKFAFFTMWDEMKHVWSLKAKYPNMDISPSGGWCFAFTVILIVFGVIQWYMKESGAWVIIPTTIVFWVAYFWAFMWSYEKWVIPKYKRMNSPMFMM